MGIDPEIQEVIKRIDQNMQRIDGNVTELYNRTNEDTKTLAVVNSKVKWHDRIAIGLLAVIFGTITTGAIKMIFFSGV
jgi:hypothetical protein